jgi:hypothetical protein
MNNSKKGLSKLSKIDAGIAERTGVLQILRDQFPKIIGEMIELLIAANKDCENHLHEFAFELDGIAYLYGRRFNSRLVNYSPLSALKAILTISLISTSAAKSSKQQ